MADKEIFEKNLRRLIHSAGPELQLPEEKKSQILEKLTAAGAAPEAAQKAEPVWRTIIKSRTTKLAAAAVIVISVSFLIVFLNPNEQADTAKTAQSHISPAELTTFASLSFAYRQGGMEMVEQMCDEALTMAGPRPASISMQDLLEQNNGKNPERTKL